MAVITEEILEITPVQQPSQPVAATPPPPAVAQKPINLFVATPCYGGTVGVAYFTSMMQAVQVLSKHGVSMHLNTLSCESLITRARNHQLSVFLGNKEFTHMLFIDSDIGFDPEIIVELIRADFPVSAVPYPKKAYDFDRIKRALAKDPETSAADLQKSGIEYVVNILNSNSTSREVPLHKGHFVSVSDAGTGFLMMKRDVLEQMVQAYPELKYTNDNAHYKPYDSTSYALFDTMLERGTRRYLSEDYAFCRRLRDLGGSIMMATKWSLSHTGVHSFEGNFVKSVTA